MHKQPVYQNAPAYVNGVSEVIFKVGVFSKTYPSFLTLKEGSTSHLGLLPSGKKRETALRCSEPLRYKVGGPSKVCAMLCRMGPPSEENSQFIIYN